MTALAKIGDNQPPHPIDEALAPFGDAISEAENWCDGEPIKTEAQMKEVDALLKNIKAAKKAVSDAEESDAKPMFDAWKAKKAEYAPTLTDLDRIVKSLVSVVGDFKKKLAAEKAEAARKAEAEAWRKAREAEEASRKANAGDLEAQRNAAALQAAFDDAEAAARAAKGDTVKGMRTVTKHEIKDHRAALHWIAANDRDAITAFVVEYVRKNHKDKNIDGVVVWTDKEAF
jgi:hypothetical protein